MSIEPEVIVRLYHQAVKKELTPFVLYC